MAVVFDGSGSFRWRPCNNQLVQCEGGTARGQEGSIRQCNNQLMFHHATTTICGIVICRAATVLPSILVCHAMVIHNVIFDRTAMAIGGIIFGCITMEIRGIVVCVPLW